MCIINASANLLRLTYIKKKRYTKCTTKTKHSYVEIADKNLYSPQASKNSLQKKDSQTSQHVAWIAAEQERTALADVLLTVKEKCSTQFALNVEKRLRFLSNQRETVLCIAATVFQNKDSF